MRSFAIASIVLAGAAGLAYAQPTPPEPGGDTTGAGEPPPPPTTPMAPPTAPTPPPPPTPPHMHGDAGGDIRPSELSIGIGAGYTLSTSLETPNTVSVRVRLPGGLAFEPILRVRNINETKETDDGMGMTTSTTSGTTELGAAVNVLFPVWKRGRADFLVLGTLAFDTEKVTPDTSIGDTNNTTTAFSVGYGVEVGFWVSRHWQITMTATNPIVVYTQTVMNVTGGAAMKDSTTTIGLIHDPTVTFLVHLFI